MAAVILLPATTVSGSAAAASTFLSASNPISSLSVIKPNHKFKPAFFLSNASLSIQEPLLSSDPLINSSISRQHAVDYADFLKLSVRSGDVELTRVVHAMVLKLEEDTRLSNALISAYLKLGLVDYALAVFDCLSSPDIKSYTAIISGFAKINREIEAVELFFEMRGSGIEPNEYSFVALLTACIRSQNLELGVQVHALMIKLGYLDCTYVVNALMGLYSKCGSLDFVIELFDNLPKRDIASWNTMISGMVKESMFGRAFELFNDMQRTDCLRVDYITLSTLLNACSECFVRRGQELHAHALRIGYESNLSVNNALIKFYTRCGSIKSVMALFERMLVRDAFTWNEMITAYMESGLVDLAKELFDHLPEKNAVLYNAVLAGFCQNGEGLRAMAFFYRMVKESIEFSDFTLTSIAYACGLLMERKSSKQIHGFILKSGCEPNDCIEAALLDMCTRCGRMEDAEKIFHRMPLGHGRLIALTSMLCGYAQNGQPENAISLFLETQLEGLLVVDEVATATVLGVCGTLGLLKLGENLHCLALKHGFLSDVVVGNAVISMYAKCGELEDAVKAFELMPSRDLCSWNSLLAGYVLHRRGDEALDTWSRMERLGIVPDSFTCLHILSAYRHTTTNLVNRCQSFFFSMQSAYGVLPASDHYACLVSVLGYWGLLEEAEETITTMPFEPKPSVWRALLDSCIMHLNSTIGKRVIKKILSIEPQDPSTFILKSNLYSASGRWQCSELVRAEMKEKGFQKIPGQSWVICQHKFHSFFARDTSHLQSKDIYSALDILILECMKRGYAPDTSYVLHEVEEYQKKDFLFHHSAKLALTFGLLMTKPGKPVRIMKNILLCGDCHTFFKSASIVTKREIHVRDTSGFHCFLNGKCSCNDRW
ncbi:pentatricopeptide repeat-containing protein At5g03800 [Ipomoea triloba]|uniref:pentatricopeptide repeat-containing protein At5g03800 n=1 Tax=Ipomoea triloba TaxID=35885 RepID=UPI00125CDFC1|nr:pentatricopeptide repeat-containing protein At5g03800 [Ipomoea triloba]